MTTLALNDMFQRWFFRGPSATESVELTDGLMMYLWWHSIFWFVLLMGLTLTFAIKYRRRPGVPAQPSPSHHTALETFWTVVPTLLLVVIFVFGFRGYIDKLVPHGDALELNVKGSMWSWSVTYPNGAQSLETVKLDEGGRDVPVFVVPAGGEVKLRMSSTDVIHSFWVPDLRVKMDVFPNRYTGYGFTVPELDDDQTHRDMWVFCAEYCGDNHSEMAAVFRVVPRAVFNTTLAEWGTPEVGIGTGQAVFATRCASCHRTDATPNGMAPSWQGGAQFNAQTYGFGYPVTFTDGTSLEARDANYVRESILTPNAKVVAGFPSNMPPFDGLLNDAQLESVIMYYQSLSDRGPKMDLEDAEGQAAPGGEGDDTQEDPPGEAAPADDAPAGAAPAAGDQTGTP